MTGRREFLLGAASLAGATVIGRGWAAGVDAPARPASIEPIQLSEAEWRRHLPPKAFAVLRNEATEPRGSSPLTDEERKGTYHCAGCGLLLFHSKWKFHSGTGWPSFYQVVKDHVGTKTDYKIIFPRTEYHCIRCGGHQGHVFDGWDTPTGLRYCNNGVALEFHPATV